MCLWIFVEKYFISYIKKFLDKKSTALLSLSFICLSSYSISHKTNFKRWALVFITGVEYSRFVLSVWIISFLSKISGLYSFILLMIEAVPYQIIKFILGFGGFWWIISNYIAVLYKYWWKSFVWCIRIKFKTTI